MIVSVKGLVMDKVMSTNEKGEKKHKLHMYQKGNKNLVIVTVNEDVYNKAVENKEMSLSNIMVGMYSMNGKSGQYAKQLENF
ncbi:hypothetical protein PV797_06825 [Clostridiaceae bacterium M8S5]|nr:hypothetical protein PV797_13355 [Clostridiaceae bacterium M8S5]WDV47382.1 hypothetical protein PV797_06825 [Clostridiaceae bacterium M8S5]